MGVRRYEAIIIPTIIVAIAIGIGEVSDFVYAEEKGRTTSLEALGILQIAAHDLYNFDRCGDDIGCAIENEDHKLNLSTLLEEKTAGCTAFVDCIPFSDDDISNGGEARNSDSILIFTVASELGEKYLELRDQFGEDLAYEKILEIYHEEVEDAFEQTFNQPFPDPQEGLIDNNHNLALRSGHDFLPSTVEFNGEQVPVFDPILFGGAKFSESELKQPSSPLDGQFDDFWNGCVGPDTPPSCTIGTVPLLFLDQTFGFIHTDNEFTFDEFMDQTSDGRYDSDEDVTQLLIEQFARGINLDERKKSNGGDEAWDTRPTSGLNYENGQQLVYDGFGWNGNFLTVEFDHYQPFTKEELKIGERSTLTAKVYASNGLASQSFGLGIQDIGSNDAEVELRANLNRDGSIDSIEVIQKTDVVNPETLTVSNEKVYCKEGDAEKLCDQLEFTFTLQELLQYEKAYSQHIDFKRRAGQIWVNHGFEITGEPINPMLTKMIPSTVKYEGLLKVTQVAKYSPYWVAEDDRMFEMNSFGSFKQINQSFERFQDTGNAFTRMHSGYGGIIAHEQNRALDIFDASNLVSELPPSFAYIYPETSQRITDEMRQAMLLQEQIAHEILDEMNKQDRHY